MTLEIQGEALNDVVCLYQGTSGFSGPQSQPHSQSSSSPRHQQERHYLNTFRDQYLREMKRLDDLVNTPHWRFGHRYVPSPTFAPQQAEGARQVLRQEAEASLSAAELAHSSAQLIKVHLPYIQLCNPVLSICPGI